MKKQINEIERMKRLAGLITESKLEEAVDTLNILKTTSESGNKQITLSVLGAGFQDNQLTLSEEEAKALKVLADEFLRNRNNEISKGVNTKDENSTQSIISIKPAGLNCIIARKEGSVYKGYDEKIGSATGYLKAQQSIVYQIAEDLDKKINEVFGTSIITKTKTMKDIKLADMINHLLKENNEKLNELQVKPGTKPTIGAKSSDVKSLIQHIDSNTTLKNRLQTVNNATEVHEFLTYILNTINPKVSGVNKANLIKIINKRFK